MYSRYFKIKLLIPILLIFTLSTACGPQSFCCPSERDEMGCQHPYYSSTEAYRLTAQAALNSALNYNSTPTQEPAKEPIQSNPARTDCVPNQPQATKGGCSFKTKAGITCDGKNNIVTIQTSGNGFSGTLPGFTCTTSADKISCTGLKKEKGTTLNVTVCGPATISGVNECTDQPGTFFNGDLKICLPLGSSCCPTGQE
jgi:hypothetical protein